MHFVGLWRKNRGPPRVLGCCDVLGCSEVCYFETKPGEGITSNNRAGRLGCASCQFLSLTRLRKNRESQLSKAGNVFVEGKLRLVPAFTGTGLEHIMRAQWRWRTTARATLAVASSIGLLHHVSPHNCQQGQSHSSRDQVENPDLISNTCLTYLSSAFLTKLRSLLLAQRQHRQLQWKAFREI